MQTGFKLHKQAVLLEYNLNKVVDYVQGKENSALADITEVYEQPVRLIREILWEMEQREKERLSERNQWLMQMIQERYSPYEQCVLSQLDEDICLSLCADLETLRQGLRTSLRV